AYVIYEHYKLFLIVLGMVSIAGFTVAVVWRWQYRSAIVFGVAWTILTVGLFVLALWPYASDRFMYYPDMGVALVLGGSAEEAFRAFTSGNRPVRFIVGIA